MTLATAIARRSASSGATAGSIAVTYGACMARPPQATSGSTEQSHRSRGPWGAPPPLPAADAPPPVAPTRPLLQNPVGDLLQQLEKT
jgi:hypothetical protein